MVRESRFRKILDVLIETKYRNTLDYALKHPAIVILISTVIFLGSLSLFPLVGVSFFPKAEKPQFLIDINLPEGTSLDKTDDVARFVESVLAERDEVFTYASNIGRGNPRIYYNAVSRHEKSNYAQIL